MKTKSQWVLETSSKKTHWGWTSFFKENEEARAKAAYESRKKDRHFAFVRLYKETWKVEA